MPEHFMRKLNCVPRTIASMSTEPGQKRYDRQMRIWGPHGQAQLERAHVCLLNASATGAEALKNLVLGGINAFTIVDDRQVFPLHSTISA